jgi:glutamate-1-semialdehyde 2,1-aminomutase
LTLEKFKEKKFGILIAVRSDSKRLPGKHFKIINKKLNLTVVDYCIRRCKKSNIKNIILCTSNNKNDNIFEKYSKKNNIKIFRGDKKNVLKRFIDCAEKNKITDIVRITGDCPLIDDKIINKCVNIYKKKNYDYLGNVMPPSFPDGLDVEVFKLSTLKQSFKENKSINNKEHVTFHIRKSKKFKKYNIKNKNNLSKIRWTVDTMDDLNLIKKIVMTFHPRIFFGWKEIYKLKKFNKI